MSFNLFKETVSFIHLLVSPKHWIDGVDDDQRKACIETLLSHYDNELSEYCLQRLLTHSSCCSIQQIQTLFSQLYFCMLMCKYNQIPVDEVDLETTPKSQQYPVVAAFCEDLLKEESYGFSVHFIVESQSPILLTTFSIISLTK